MLLLVCNQVSRCICVTLPLPLTRCFCFMIWLRVKQLLILEHPTRCSGKARSAFTDSRAEGEEGDVRCCELLAVHQLHHEGEEDDGRSVVEQALSSWPLRRAEFRNARPLRHS